MKIKINLKKNKIFVLLFLLALGLVLLTGGFLRIWQLNNIPPGVQYDEAYNGLDGLWATQASNFKVFYPGNNGREGLYINLVGLSLFHLGISNFSLRLVSALIGILALPGFYLLLRALDLSRFTSFWGTFMLAFSYWHLNFSRTAYRGILVPLLLIWSFYFFFSGLKKQKSWLYFAISGLVFGLGFHTYISFRVAPAILFSLCFFLFLTAHPRKLSRPSTSSRRRWVSIFGNFFSQNDFLRKQWKNALVFIIATSVSAAPIACYFYHHPADFSGRSNSVSIFNAPNLSPAHAFIKSLTFHLGAFFVYGDPNARHNYHAQPLLPTPWSVLFLLGFIISLKEIIQTTIRRFHNKPPTALFLPSLWGQSTFWVMLLPGVLSIEGIPHALRIIGVIPAVFLLIALPLEYIYLLYLRLKKSPLLELKPWRWNIMRISLAGLMVIIAASGAKQAYTYFYLWPNDPETMNAFERKLFDLGHLIKTLPLQERNFLIVSSSVQVSTDHRSSSLKTTEFSGYPTSHLFLYWRPLDALDKTTCEKALYVFQEADAWLIKQFEKKCPNLKAQKITPPQGVYDFWVLK